MINDIFNQATVASDSFAIDLTGTFRTAGYGGAKLDVQQGGPSVDTTFKPETP